MTHKKLPIGIQTFSEVIDGNYLYIDKTEAIHTLIDSGKYYFLSRPRRFGKSLTLSTIQAIYEGRKALFSGLWVEDQWDWTQKKPVILLSFSSIGYHHLGLVDALRAELALMSRDFSIHLTESSIDRQFKELIRKIAERYGKVVLLIDEYDKPLIDYLDDIDQAKANQKILKNFYSVIKDSDPYLELMLITGISKFSKVSIFSDLNNLYDISQDYRFATLLGYTQEELEHYFQPYMPLIEQRLRLDRPALLAKLKHWYNGYSWDAEHFVYNPFSILNVFQAARFANFWFETGTPTFLVKLIRREWLYDMSEVEISDHSFVSYDLEHLQAIPILLQTGYLTIKSHDEYGLYQLDYPNAEVKESLLNIMNEQKP